jgi:ABC-type multidrug transport system ATPase subunit
MIELTEVRKRYGRARPRTGAPEALRGVTLRIQPGSVTAVVGPNGAGKTTLFGVALGFLTPSAGDASIEGQDPRDWLARNGAGWLPERFAPPGAWRVAETVRAFARLDGLGALAGTAARDTLDRFGLTTVADRSVGTLSRGLLQRVGLAQALVARHRLIVLDEPTGGLDPAGRAAFRETLAELRRDNVTILLASHDMAEIERTADSVVLLDDGRIRDVVAARAPADYSRFRLVLSAPAPVLKATFPDAESGSRAPDEDGNLLTIVVSVPDVADLNQRLAKFIATGGIIYEVAPVADALETRISKLRDTGNTDPQSGAREP